MLCVNFNKSSFEDVINILKKEKLPAEKSNLETAVLTSSIGRYSRVVTKNFAHVQDENSQFISFIASSLGDNILDFCAGNGGKSLAIASLSRNKKNIFAYDINQKKQLMLKQRIMEYNAKVTVEEKLPDNEFEVLLVDAPCTGLGAARRNPEVKYLDGPGNYPELQQNILVEAAQKLKPDGFLFYTVCTFTPDETEDVIKKFSAEKKFKILNLDNIVYSQFLDKTRYGAFTSIPKGDIFFVSLLKK